MTDYHVGCGLFGIYAGTLKKNNKEWLNKTECTDEALEAVREYMINELLGGYDCETAISSGYEWKLKDGRFVELRTSIRTEGQIVTVIKKAHWNREYKSGVKVDDGYVSSCCDMWNKYNSNFCPHCGAMMEV